MKTYLIQFRQVSEHLDHSNHQTQFPCYQKKSKQNTSYKLAFPVFILTNNARTNVYLVFKQHTCKFYYCLLIFVELDIHIYL